MWDGGVMENLVIYTTHHSIHKVVKCRRLQEIHSSFSAETRNIHKIVVVRRVARLQQRCRDNMKLHRGEVGSGCVKWFEVGEYYSQHYF
jgi:hypothetical protein